MCKLTDKIQEDSWILGQLIADTIRENKYLKQTSLYSTTLVESSDDCVYVTDIETNEILFINEETKTVWGCCWANLLRSLSWLRCSLFLLHKR